jgi:hypothetical protein
MQWDYALPQQCYLFLNNDLRPKFMNICVRSNQMEISRDNDNGDLEERRECVGDHRR